MEVPTANGACFSPRAARWLISVWFVLAVPFGFPRRGAAAPLASFVFEGPWVELGVLPGIFLWSQAPTMVDLDGDGDLDAFAWQVYGSALFAENTGTTRTPAFASPSLQRFGLTAKGGYAWSPAFGDIDGDGDLDLFVGEYYGHTYFFRNTGDARNPAFAAPVTDPFGLTVVNWATEPVLGDIDGDGDLDVFLGGYRQTFFFSNTGSAANPSFASPSLAPFGLSDSTIEEPSLVDIDGDGDLDFVGGWSNLGPSLAKNTGSAISPAFAGGVQHAFPFPSFTFQEGIAFGDIDGDGDLDAFLRNDQGHLLWIPNTGSASSPSFPLQNPYGFPWYVVSFADIDGDGDLDAFNNNRFSENQGSPSRAVFAPPSWAIALPSNGRLDFIDFDGDGDLDAFTENQLFENTGTRTSPAFAAPVTLFGSIGGEISAFGDLDGDGNVDVLVGQDSGDLLFLRNSGSAATLAFAPASSNPFGLTRVAGSAWPTFVDVDRDGDLDLFVGQTGQGTVFFKNTGTATSPAFGAPVLDPFGLHSEVVGGYIGPASTFVDIDGDGDLDAFVASDAEVVFFRGTSAIPVFADGFESGGTSSWSGTK